MIDWIENWYESHCDGDWEHDFGVSIDTLDNPGWLVKINLDDTGREYRDVETKLHKKSDVD